MPNPPSCDGDIGMVTWTPSDFAKLAPAGARRQDTLGKADPLVARDWKSLRSAIRDQDIKLGALAVAWSIQLDLSIYPSELIKSYPRIANRLALCWNDPVLAARLLDSLLQDRRGGRRGFPAAVRVDLLRLRKAFPQSNAVAPPSGAWSLLATSDR
jgi:hypothetical protein